MLIEGGICLIWRWWLPRLEEDTCINLTRNIVLFALRPAITAYAKTALCRLNEKSAAATKPDALLKKGGKWSHRESNSNLIFRRDLFYPLNYETPQCVCGCKGSQIMC